MALSGVLGNTFRNGWRLQLEWTATQNLTTNTSTVTSKLYLISQQSWATIISSSSNGYRVNVNGEVYTGNFNPSLSGNQKKLISTDTTTVAHNSDGRKNFSIGAYADLKVTLSGTYYGRVTIANQTFTLDTIPRYSTLSGNLNWTIGNDLPLKINRASSSFSSRLLIKVNGTTYYDNTNVPDNFTWQPGSTVLNNIYNSIPNDMKTDLFIRLYTYSGSTMIGFNDYTGTATVVNAKPEFENFTYRDTTYSGVTGNNQVIIQGKSNVRVEVPSGSRATAVKGASMVSYQINFGNKTVNMNYSNATISSNIGTTTSKGTVPLSVTAIDSRGLKTTLTKNVQVLEYEVPLSKSTAERFGGFEETTEITLKGTYSPIRVGGIAKNYIYSLQYRIFEKGGTKPSFTTVSTSTITYSGNTFKATTFTKPLDINKTYTVEFRVEDRITGGQFEEVTVYSGIPPWLFEGDGNIRFRGGLIQVGNEKTLADDGKAVQRFTGATGTDAGLRALKMGDNSVSRGISTNFPSTTGAWLYYQGADTQGDTNGDFILWKDRLNDKPELYIGVVKEGQATDFQKIVTLVEEGTYSRSGTTGSYIKYSDGRLEVEFEKSFSSTSFRGSNNVMYAWITGDIWFPIEAPFIEPPTIFSNASAGEIFGFANRETFTTRFNLRLFASAALTMGITVRGFAKGKWK